MRQTFRPSRWTDQLRGTFVRRTPRAAHNAGNQSKHRRQFKRTDSCCQMALLKKGAHVINIASSSFSRGRPFHHLFFRQSRRCELHPRLGRRKSRFTYSCRHSPAHQYPHAPAKLSRMKMLARCSIPKCRPNGRGSVDAK